MDRGSFRGMGDPARTTPATPPAEAERVEHYARQLRAAGVDPAADLTAESPATLEETLAWLRGEGPCPDRG